MLHLEKAGAQVWLATTLAMVAFASNSLLNRFALGSGLLDAASFTAIRIVSGAIMLAALVAMRTRPERSRRRPGTHISALLLFAYAAGFSFAYVRIGAGTGALLLFGAVQAVMYTGGLLRGERPGALGWTGLVVAVTGVVTLLLPGATVPDPVGAVLMLGAGGAWGAYTLRGRGAVDPLGETAVNFAYAVPLVVLLEVGASRVPAAHLTVTGRGVALAIVSGAITSALGYALWYATLPFLTRIQAGIAQLTPVPLAILGGQALLDEPVTMRIVLASLLVLAGVGLGLVASGRAPARRAGDTEERATPRDADAPMASSDVRENRVPRADA